MSKIGKLCHNIGLIAIGTFGSKFLTFLLVPLYTSYLTTYEYGIADLIVTTVALIYPVFTATISESVLRYALDEKTSNSDVFSIGLITNILGFVLLLFFTPFLLSFDFLRNNYILFLLYYISYIFYQFLSFFARGINKIKVYTVSGIFQTLTLVFSNIILLVFLDMNLVGYLLAMILSNIAGCLILICGAKIFNYINFTTINTELLKEMLSYSLPMIPNSISWWISNSSDKYILNIFCGATITGIYSISYKIPIILSICYNIFISAWRISSVDEFGSIDSQIFHTIVLKKMFYCLLFIAAGIILLNEPLARLLYAKDFYAAKFYVPVLIIAVFIHGISEYYGTIYTSAKKTNMLFYSSFLGASINILLNLCLIPTFEAMGAAIATLVSYICIVIFRVIHSRSIMKLDINYNQIILSFFLLTIMCYCQTVEFQNYLVISLIIFLMIFRMSYLNLKDLFSKIISLVIKK